MMNFQKAIKMLEEISENNTAGHNCVKVASLHLVAAASIKNELTSAELFTPAEKKHLSKAVEWYEKGLTKYEKDERMNDYKEAIYNSIRMHYQQMALRYFTLSTEQITEQDLCCMEELLQKSLTYCFKDESKTKLKNSQICAAENYLTLARVYDIKAATCTNPDRKKTLRQKREENFQSSFNIYTRIQWQRSQMDCKCIWIQSLLNESETKLMNPPANKELIQHLSDLHNVLLALKNGTCDPDDIHFTDLSAVKQLNVTLNAACHSILKIDISNTGVKQLYQRSLHLTTLSKLDEVLPPLTTILADLKNVLGT